MAHVDDLTECRPQQVHLTVVSRSPHRLPQRRSPAGGNHEPPKIRIPKRKKASPNARFLAKSITRSNPIVPVPQPDPYSSRATTCARGGGSQAPSHQCEPFGSSSQEACWSGVCPRLPTGSTRLDMRVSNRRWPEAGAIDF
jgi:hypothetical protein